MKWFLLNAGEILIDKKYISVVQSSTWKLSGWNYIKGSGGKYKDKYLHKIIAELAGLDTTDEIDHIDGNPRNNLLSNLRPATHAENMRNCKIQSNNISGYPGVYWNKEHQKWHARISVNGKYIHLGYFNNLEEAIKIRKEAARKYHGEFARI